MQKVLWFTLKFISTIWIMNIYYNLRIQMQKNKLKNGHLKLPVEIRPPERKMPVYFSGLVEDTGEAFMLLETLQYPAVISKGSPYGNNEGTAQLRRGYKFVIGITSNKGSHENLLGTIKSLLYSIGIKEISKPDNMRFLLVLQLSETEKETSKERALELEQRFRRLVHNGNIDIIIPRRSWYDGINSSDAKEIVDYAHMMLYAASKGDYYIHLHHTCTVELDFLNKVETFIEELETNFWLSLSLTGVGLYGKLIRASDLYGLVVDFLENSYRNTSTVELFKAYVNKVHSHCDLSQRRIDATCHQELGISDIQYRPSLFNCTANPQLSMPRDPNNPTSHEPYPWEEVPIYLNPKADLWTSMKVIEGHDLHGAYDLQGYFFVEKPKAGDVIYFNFTPPVVLEEFYIRSWHSEHPRAHFDSTTYVDALPVYPENINLSNTYYFRYKALGDGYFKAGRFNERSIAENPLGDNFGKISSIRIRVTSDYDHPAVIREMIFKVQVVPSSVKPCCEPYWKDPFSKGIPGYKPLDY